VGETIEPWMYPEILPQVRDTIKRRYEILPYIYSLGLESHLEASPSQRWVGWGYESDPEVWTDKLKAGDEQFWFGDTLLIAGVYKPGARTARVYLPRKRGDIFDYGYVNTNAPYEYLASGQWATVSSEWRQSIPVLARIGGAVPVGRSEQTRMPGEGIPACRSLKSDDYRGIEIFPPEGSSHGTIFEYTWYDDDGISRIPDISTFTVRYSSTCDRVIVNFSVNSSNSFIAPWQTALTFILLPGDERFVVSEDGTPLVNLENDSRGRPRYRMALHMLDQSDSHSQWEVNGHRGEND
jgi:alpha-glucosidase (family GH31 glycosyl hydrolase)